MPRKLFVDDERMPPAPTHEWDIVRTAEAAIALLDQVDYDEVALDHDLGSDYGTGYDVICFLEERLGYNHVPEIITCHSASPPGRKRIETVIRKIEERR